MKQTTVVDKLNRLQRLASPGIAEEMRTIDIVPTWYDFKIQFSYISSTHSLRSKFTTYIHKYTKEQKYKTFDLLIVILLKYELQLSNSESANISPQFPQTHSHLDVLIPLEIQQSRKASNLAIYI